MNEFLLEQIEPNTSVPPTTTHGDSFIAASVTVGVTVSVVATDALLVFTAFPPLLLPF